jgi:hypothetical protein
MAANVLLFWIAALGAVLAGAELARAVAYATLPRGSFGGKWPSAASTLVPTTSLAFLLLPIVTTPIWLAPVIGQAAIGGGRAWRALAIAAASSAAAASGIVAAAGLLYETSPVFGMILGGSLRDSARTTTEAWRDIVLVLATAACVIAGVSISSDPPPIWQAVVAVWAQAIALGLAVSGLRISYSVRATSSARPARRSGCPLSQMPVTTRAPT